MRTTADEVIQRSEVERSERAQPFSINYKPMYSKERIRRRALCEALLEGIPDFDLLSSGVRDVLAQLRKQSETRSAEAAKGEN